MAIKKMASNGFVNPMGVNAAPTSRLPRVARGAFMGTRGLAASGSKVAK